MEVSVPQWFLRRRGYEQIRKGWQYTQQDKTRTDMKTKQSKPVSHIECGKDEWESTNEYRIKVDRIVKEVTDKYSEALLNERRWFKRLLIKDRIELETRKR